MRFKHAYELVPLLPLYRAINMSSPKLVNKVIALGAEINTFYYDFNRDSTTVLHLGAEQGNRHLLATLVHYHIESFKFILPYFSNPLVYNYKREYLDIYLQVCPSITENEILDGVCET